MKPQVSISVELFEQVAKRKSWFDLQKIDNRSLLEAVVLVASHVSFYLAPVHYDQLGFGRVQVDARQKLMTLFEHLLREFIALFDPQTRQKAFEYAFEMSLKTKSGTRFSISFMYHYDYECLRIDSGLLYSDERFLSCS